ncbi:hypothetical protein QFC21_002429 [Naganishia friedmannii]|uniref:Uncharacterized protein n=1 Tax=Naganishia friedmannii TaxID=89922 RepID=A0ACC2VYU5_9TREE|nr:hypothetical protein QFC21_002429 [Naganishia friedmannii]
MSFLKRAKDRVRNFQSSQPATGSSSLPAAEEEATERSLCWKADFGQESPVTKNFYHELGNHGWGNNEAQNYVNAPANSFHGKHTSSNGTTTTPALIIRAIINHSAHDKSHDAYTSARLSSHRGLGHPRGYLSARITAPVAPGIWPAFWLLPQDPFVWPNEGEVDIMESWNGDPDNHSCLHWGHYNGQDWNKHRVLKTRTPGLPTADGVLFGFAWSEDPATGIGKLIWYINNIPIMRASKPPGTRPMKDFRILFNIAVGGTLNKGRLPEDGVYEMAVREMEVWDAPPPSVGGGWAGFERDWKRTQEGLSASIIGRSRSIL